MSKRDLVSRPLQVVNLGVEGFHQALLAQQCRSLWLDWRPPCGGDARLIEQVERLSDLPTVIEK